MEEIKEREISIKHLSIILCKKWKQIIVYALVGAVVLGLYGYCKGKSFVKKIDTNELIQKESNLASLQNYLNNSIFMKNSNSGFWKHSLQIDIFAKEEDPENIMQIFESYTNIIQSEDFYDFIAGEIDEPPNYIYEIINLENINGTIYTLREDSKGNITLSFMISILGPDVKFTSQIASAIKKYIEKQKTTIYSTKYSHDINIYNIGSISIGVDTNKKNMLEKCIKSLKAEIASIRGDNISYKKWIIIGFFAGALIIVGIYILLYILSDSLHEGEEIESLFDVKTWNTKKIQRQRLKEVLIATIMAKYDEYNTILVTGTVFSDNLKKFLEEVNKKVSKKSFVVFQDAINNPEAIKALSKINAVILLETIEKSKMTEIYREVKYIKQNNVPIIGCIVEE